MRGLVAVAAALVALATAPAAVADVTFGSALDAPPGGIALHDCAGTGGCTTSLVSIAGQPADAPVAGVLTRWRVQAGPTTSPIRLQVVRRSAQDGFVIGESAEVRPPANRVSVYPVRIPIEAGDQLALCCFLEAGSYLAPVAATTTTWSPPLGATPRPGNPFGVELLVSGDIEPDGDGDGFGDETQDDCPTVSSVAPRGCPALPAPRVNAPPTVRFRTPTTGTAVSTAQAIELEVSDDAGNATVTVSDDDGTICTVSAPPYTCTWTPTGADVGRATLLASAVDAEGASALAFLRVTAPRFKADLTRRLRGRRVTGRLVLPAAVEPALGCRGKVTVRRGKVRRTVALKRNCTYSAPLPGGRGRLRARFAGNAVVAPAT